MIKNPTQKQLKELKMIVYLFQDKRNNKKYVGQTKHTLKARYQNSKRRTYFEKVIKKYGWERFEITILKHSLKTFEELDSWENFYIKEFNTLSPNGYNLIGGGCSNHSWGEEIKEKMRKNIKTKKKFALKNIETGDIVETENIREFCRKQNVNRSGIGRVINKQLFISQGWALPETEVAFHTVQNLNTGEIIRFHNERKFAKQHKINDRNIYHLVSKQISSHKGWILVDSIDYQI